MSGAGSHYWIFILGVCAFIVAGVAGTCAGQSLPCPVLRRPPKAGQPPVVPPQQQRVQLPGPHRKLLGQDTCVSPHNTNFSCIGLFVCEQLLKHSAFRHPAAHHNGLSMNHALLGLSPNIPPGPKEGDLAHDMSHEAAAHKRNHTDKGESVHSQARGVRVEKPSVDPACS